MIFQKIDKKVKKEIARKNIGKNRMFWISLICVFLLWLLIPGVILWINDGYLDDAGSMGDIFGSVNALFTAIAFALLIYNTMLQREELALQREELSLTREELKKSAAAQNNLAKLTMQQLNLQLNVRKKSIIPVFCSDNFPDYQK